MSVHSTRKQVVRIVITVLMFAVAFTTIFPLLWMISASLKFEGDVFAYPIQWIPERMNAAVNYRTVWLENNFVLFYWNTIKVAVLTTIAQVTVSMMGAYAFAKINFRFKEQVFFFYLVTLMIPPQMTIIPTFMIFKWFNLIDKHAGLVIVAAFSVYGTFLIRQYMMGIPEELSESARMDGAGHWVIFSRIVAPIAKPAIATLIILKFIWVWNDFQNPLIYINSERLYTLQVAINMFQTEYGRFYALMMTAAVSAILPLILVYVIFQRYVVDGITVGAVKG